MAISKSKQAFIRNNLIQLFGTTPKPPAIHGSEKYVIINGDDLCKDEQTTSAILTAYKEGIVTSTSAFINLEGSAEQLKKIHALHPGLPIGLHLNLTLGSPVAKLKEVKGLTDAAGNFHGINHIIRHLPSMKFSEVRTELFAQAALFASTGIPMSHINYHHHIAALYTPFFVAVKELAHKYKVPLRNPVPASIYNFISLNGNGGGGAAGLRTLLKFGMAHPFKFIPLIKKVRPDALVWQKNLMFAEGIKSTDWFIDSFYMNATVENFISLLEQIPAGVSEILCHPGLGRELEVLTDDSVKKVLKSLGIHLVSWDYLNQAENRWIN